MFGHRSSTDPRRRDLRHAPEGVTCPLGEVIDLSASGMRVVGKGRPLLQVGQSGMLRVNCGDGTVSLEAQVIWVKKRGFRRHEIGLQFLNLPPGVRKALDVVAQFGFLPKGAVAATKRQRRQARAMINLPDYYKVLGVRYDATEGDIQQAYRQLARAYHPDVANDADSNRKFREINDAYQVLKDAEKRTLFDLRAAI